MLKHKIETPLDCEPGFLVLAGSRMVGIHTDSSDYDYVGALVEPETYRVGLDTYSQGKHHQHGFEQHMFKSDGYEGSIYSLWKLANMLAECNPTILSLMFAQPIVDDYGINTDAFRALVVSKKAGHRFMRYMEAQRKSMIGQRAKHVTRQALVDAHGYDTKFAAHTIRLGFQGIEFLNHGTITLPMTQPDREIILDIRNGEWKMEEVLLYAEELEREMEVSYRRSKLPDEPNHKALNEWLVRRYMNTWWLRKNPEEPLDILG